MSKREHIKISVIMATYNTPREYLNESINSILNQSHKNLELIIICDGIKEEYDYIIGNFDDKRIKVELNNTNIGLAASLNKAIELSTGDYIARMDSDDICFRKRMYNQLKFMEQNNNIDICAMYAQCFGNKKNILGVYFNDQYSINVQLSYECCIVHPTVMFRRKFLFDNDIRYDEEFKCSQDFELWSRVKNNNIYVIPKIGLFYRFHDKQITKQKRNQQLEMTNLIIENNIERNDLFCNDKEKYRYLLKKLNGLYEIEINDIDKLSDYIDDYINEEDNYSEKTLEKILYNKFFKRLINDKLLIKNLKSILFNKKLRKKIFNLTNFKFILFIGINKIKSKFLRLKMR